MPLDKNSGQTGYAPYDQWSNNPSYNGTDGTEQSPYKGQMRYNGGTADSPSSIDFSSMSKQEKEYMLDQQMIRYTVPYAIFSQLGSTKGVPLHHGKTIKKQIMYPILDDRNVNDQGIDVNGITFYETYKYDENTKEWVPKDPNVKMSNNVFGNMYGNSLDIEVVYGNFGQIPETGGRYNRIGFSRAEVQATLSDFGFFYEYTKDAIRHDSDPGLLSTYMQEAYQAATQMRERAIQYDLLAGAGVVFNTGVATNIETISGQEGEGATAEASVVTYKDLLQIEAALNKNGCPKDTEMLTGSDRIGTAILPSCRVLFVSDALIPMLRAMKDYDGKSAFIPIQDYGYAVKQGNSRLPMGGNAEVNALFGEVGAIGNFRIVSVTDMMEYTGQGAVVPEGVNSKFETATKNGVLRYSVYPMLVVGRESFSTLSFHHGGNGFSHSDGATASRFLTHTVLPGSAESYTREDPFGKNGFTSFQWDHGTLIERSERIAVVHTLLQH